MQLVSPTLPVGAYSYSQGIEWAREVGWIETDADFADWLLGLTHDTMAYLELPILKRLHLACKNQDLAALLHWSKIMIAFRETRELREEDHNRARAMTRLIIDLNIPNADDWRDALVVCQAAPFALAAVHWKITAHNSMLGYAWAWLENQVAAGIKLIPLGQTVGQRLLGELMPEIEQAVILASRLEDNEIGSSAPAQALASCHHETQYTRLFRS